MTSTGPTLFLLALSVSAPAAAMEPAEGPVDETLVVARTVMPRIAYHALEPTANPVRVQATVFPGRIFHGMVDTLTGRLAGDDELSERAPLGPSGAPRGLEPGIAGSLSHGPGLQHAGGGRSVGGSIGGSVLRVTSGLGDRISQAVHGAAGPGTGP